MMIHFLIRRRHLIRRLILLNCHSTQRHRRHRWLKLCRMMMGCHFRHKYHQQIRRRLL
jgi:hypothetical protein